MLTDASLSSSFSDIRAENARLRQLLQQREQQWAAENLQREQQWAAERQQLVTEVNRLKRKKEEREVRHLLTTLTLLDHTTLQDHPSEPPTKRSRGGFFAASPPCASTPSPLSAPASSAAVTATTRTNIGADIPTSCIYPTMGHLS